MNLVQSRLPPTAPQYRRKFNKLLAPKRFTCLLLPRCAHFTVEICRQPVDICSMYDHKAVIGEELEEGEALLWSAQPRQGFLLHPSDAFMIPFSLIWGGFSIVWEYQVLTSDAPLFMALIGLPFVVIGLYLIAGRFFYDARLREKTFYGITDRRVIILSGIRNKQSHYLGISEIENLQKFETKDGSGSIVMGFEAITTAYQSQMPIPGRMEATPQFNNLADVHTPFEIIEKLRKGITPAD